MAPTIPEKNLNRFAFSISFRGLLSGENKKPTIILLSAPLILTAFKYYGAQSFYTTRLSSIFALFESSELNSVLYLFFAAFILLGLIPALIVKFVFYEPLSAYGAQFGDVRFGLKAFLLLAPVMIALTFPSSRMEPFLAEYPLYRGVGSTSLTFIGYGAFYLAFYLGWEFFFRGYMQFGLRDKLGDWNSILVQTLASCLLHIGKPDAEIFGSIMGGIIWGIMAFRTGSLLFVILMHWLLGISLDVFITYF